jgi:uncharacterized protein YcbX
VRGRVAWIHVAPIKALRIQTRDQVMLGPTGVAEDRRFAIVDEAGHRLNGKRVAAFTSVRPEFDPVTQHLTLHMPDGRRVSGQIELGEPLTMSTSRRKEPCREVIGPFASALSSIAGRAVRLVRFDEVGVGVDRAREGGAATLLSAASLDAMAEVAGDGPIDPRRFRMLFGVSGVAAHAEDSWLRQQVRIGEATVMPMGNVGRCAVTTLDPETGRSDLDTLAALAVYRRDVDTTEALPFGVWARVVEPGRVAVGDDVIV